MPKRDNGTYLTLWVTPTVHDCIDKYKVAQRNVRMANAMLARYLEGRLAKGELDEAEANSWSIMDESHSNPPKKLYFTIPANCKRLQAYYDRLPDGGRHDLMGQSLAKAAEELRHPQSNRMVGQYLRAALTDVTEEVKDPGAPGWSDRSGSVATAGNGETPVKPEAQKQERSDSMPEAVVAEEVDSGSDSEVANSIQDMMDRMERDMPSYGDDM